MYIPFMGRQIHVGTKFEGRRGRNVLKVDYFNDDLLFKIFGWGGRTVPAMDRDPYLNSEFPDLASIANVEFNDTKNLTSLLARKELRRSISEASEYFTLEAGQGEPRLDSRTYGCKDNEVITDVEQLHLALEILKRMFAGMETMDSHTATEEPNS